MDTKPSLNDKPPQFQKQQSERGRHHGERMVAAEEYQQHLKILRGIRKADLEEYIDNSINYCRGKINKEPNKKKELEQYIKMLQENRNSIPQNIFRPSILGPPTPDVIKILCYLNGKECIEKTILKFILEKKKTALANQHPEKGKSHAQEVVQENPSHQASSSLGKEKIRLLVETYWHAISQADKDKYNNRSEAFQQAIEQCLLRSNPEERKAHLQRIQQILEQPQTNRPNSDLMQTSSEIEDPSHATISTGIESNDSEFAVEVQRHLYGSGIQIEPNQDTSHPRQPPDGSSQKSGAHPLENPGQKPPDESSSANKAFGKDKAPATGELIEHEHVEQPRRPSYDDKQLTEHINKLIQELREGIKPIKTSIAKLWQAPKQEITLDEVNNITKIAISLREAGQLDNKVPDKNRTQLCTSIQTLAARSNPEKKAQTTARKAAWYTIHENKQQNLEYNANRARN